MEPKPDSCPKILAVKEVLKLIQHKNLSHHIILFNQTVQKSKLLSLGFNQNLLFPISSHLWPETEYLHINILLAKQDLSFMMPSCLIFTKRMQLGLGLVII